MKKTECGHGTKVRRQGVARPDLRVESLEGRRMLACDVAFDGAQLEVSCDAADDQIAIWGDGGDLMVGGQNLGSSEFLQNIEVKSDGGHDTVSISNLEVGGSIEVKTTGDDLDATTVDDIVVLRDLVVGGSLEVKTGDGADMLHVKGLVAVGGSFEARMGAGNDTVSSDLDALAADQVELRGGSGEDSLLGWQYLMAQDDFEEKGFESGF